MVTDKCNFCYLHSSPVLWTQFLVVSQTIYISNKVCNKIYNVFVTYLNNQKRCRGFHPPPGNKGSIWQVSRPCRVVQRR